MDTRQSTEKTNQVIETPKNNNDQKVSSEQVIPKKEPAKDEKQPVPPIQNPVVEQKVSTTSQVNPPQKPVAKEVLVKNDFDFHSIVVKQYTNPYVRSVVQAGETGAAIGFIFFPIHTFIVGLQNRPPNMTPMDYVKSLNPRSAPDKSVYQSIIEMLKTNSRFIGRGVKYSCTTSFTKSMFVCNGPAVQKHIEIDFGFSHGKEVQDPSVLSEQSRFIAPYNKWVLTSAVSTVLGLAEAGCTSNTAAKATCSMLKKDIYVQGIFNNIIFAPGGLTRGSKAGFGQFTYMGTEHLAEHVKIYFPEQKYGFMATGLTSCFTGLICGGVGSVFDNFYTQQMNAIKMRKENRYVVPNMYEAGCHIYKNIGVKGFIRGAIPNMMTMPAIFLIAQGINDWFNKQERRYKTSSAQLTNGLTLFSSRRSAPPENAKQETASVTNDQPPKEPSINRKRRGD